MNRRRQIRLLVEELEPRQVMSASAAVEISAEPNDTRFNELYGMKSIQAPSAWDVSTGSRSVVVADIDSGIDYAHPDLYLNIWINQGEIPTTAGVVDVAPAGAATGDGLITFWDLNQAANAGKVPNVNSNTYIDGKDVLAFWSDGADADHNGYTDDLIGWNFITGTNDPFDNNSHGTHVAGTIGAIGNNNLGVVGVSWQVQIMALKFLDAKGSGTLANGAKAIRYAADNGASVSNNSWSYMRGSTNDVVYQAVAYAQTKNHLVVAAAGNSGINNDKSGNRAYPASFGLDNIISVAASDSRDAKASWSNYGKTTVDLAAPGVGILSTIPGGSYASYSGTSMATPHVVGTAALIVAVNPDLASSPATVKSLILNNVDPVTAFAGKTVTGGRLNASRAVNAALTATVLASSAAGESEETPGTPGGSNGNAAAQLLQAIFESFALDHAFGLSDELTRRPASPILAPETPEATQSSSSARSPAVASPAPKSPYDGIIACTGSMFVEDEVQVEAQEVEEVAE